MLPLYKSSNLIPITGSHNQLARPRELAVLLLILTIAFFLRLHGLPGMEYKQDEAGNCRLAQQAVAHWVLPQTGIASSLGNKNPPLFIWVLMLPFTISRDPLVAAAYLIVLSVAGIGATYAFCRITFGFPGAMAAASLFAVNPWAILYSRKLWQQTLLCTLAAGWAYCLLRLVTASSRTWQGIWFLAVMLLYTSLTQIHLSTVILFVPVLGVLVRYRLRIPFWSWISGAGFAIALYLPWILSNSARNYEDFRLLARASAETFQFHHSVPMMPFILGSTSHFPEPINMAWLNIAAAFMLLTGLFIAMLDWRSTGAYVVLLWFFSLLMFVASSKASAPIHYLLSLMPAVFILFGQAFGFCWQRAKISGKPAQFAVLAIFLLLTGAQLAASYRFNQLVLGASSIEWMGYGTPYRVQHQGTGIP